MSCNLINNEAELRNAFEAVSNSQNGNEWAIYEYDANSNIVKLGSMGNTAGFPELLENFHSGKVQYGFGTISGNVLPGQSSQGQRKVIMIHWQGEGVPAARLATTASHVEEIRRFVRRVNLTIYARNDEDLGRENLSKHFEKLQEISPNALGNGTATNNVTISPQTQPSLSTPFIPPNPVGTAYQKPKPKEEMDMEEREKFWNEMRNEEELRRKEEGERRRQIQEQFSKEQKDLAAQIHKLHLEKLEAQKMQHPQMEKSMSLDGIGSAGHSKKGKLIAGRTQMFEEKMAELVSSVKPMKKPKNFKWQVSLQGNSSSTPVNRVPEPPPKQFECVLKRKEQPIIAAGLNNEKKAATEQPPQEPTINKILPINTVPPIYRQPPPTEPLMTEENVKKDDCPSPPMTMPNGKINNYSGNVDEIRAKALWDYQAEDQTELSFNPDDVITQIQMVHDGWWYGKAPNGMMGLFPSNYVQLI